MKNTRLFAIFLILLISQFLSAKDLDTTQIRSAVQTWVRYITADAQPDAEIYALEPYLADSDTFLYVAHLKPRGFCICGAKYYMLPVYFYSPRGTLTEDTEKDDHIRIIGQSIIDGFRRISKENPSKITSELVPTRKPYWEMLSAGIVPPKSKGFWDGPDSMRLGEVPNWYNNQWYPFNTMAPKLAGAVCTLETPDGCVAHSMARIMRYWRWPYSGTGRDTAHFVIRRSNTWQQTPLSFNPFPATFDTVNCPWTGWKGKIMWVTTSGGRLMMKDVWDWALFEFAKKQCRSMTPAESTAFLNAMNNLWALMTEKDSLLIDRFDTVVYRWDLMPSEIGDIDSPEEIYAVSKLTYNCGQAVHMYYGTRGSTAVADPVPYETHFYYDTDAEWVDLPRCDGPDTCNCPDDWFDPPGRQADDICNCPEPDTCSGAKALVDEIQWLRPVQFAQGPYVAHAWVVWGYNRLSLPNEMQFFQDDGAWLTMDSHIIGYGMVRRIAPLNYVKFVGATTTGDGSPANPYRNIEDAIAGAPNGATLIFKAGSTNLFNSSSITIDRPMILKGRNATIKRSY